MKKLVLSLSLLLACSSVALADGNAFTPLTFDDASYAGTPATVNSSTAAKSASAKDLVGNEKMQSAILELDNAQVDVRNELLNYKAKYSDVDAQYQLIKAERKTLNKQIRSMEKRINKIEKQKEAIRKNML